jgi:hypothetical protein
MKRRLQFSIATLLAVVTVCAFGSHWYATRHRVAKAELEFNIVRSRLDFGEAEDHDVYEASVNLLHARQRTPFFNRRDACAEHLEEMTKLEALWRTLPKYSTTSAGSAEAYKDWVRECNDRADKVHAWVEEAQRWLDEAT